MPKRKAPMTMKEVAALGPGNHRVGGAPGLTLQVGPSGQSRSYTLRYSDAAGKRREVGIGSAFVITLQQARDKALELHQQRRLHGVDPLAAKEQRRQEALSSITFSEAVAGYLKTRTGTWGNDKHEQQFVNTLATYAEPFLGKLAVEAIAPTHVAQMLAPIWVSKQETSRRVRQRAEAVIAWADGHANRTRTNPAALAGLIQTGMLPKVKRDVESHAAMPWREVPAFMAKLRQSNGMAARALEFLVHTAARSGEARGAVWSEFDLAAATWTVPKERMKAGREHVVPLTEPVLALLQSLPRGEPGDLLFPGPKGELSDAAVSKALKLIRDDATVHGARSSFRDWASENKKDHVLAEMSLAHAVGTAVERAYARSNLLELRRGLLAEWSTFLTG